MGQFCGQTAEDPRFGQAPTITCTDNLAHHLRRVDAAEVQALPAELCAQLLRRRIFDRARLFGTWYVLLFDGTVQELCRNGFEAGGKRGGRGAPLFLQFAAGKRDYPCTPWGNPTRTPRGWKAPCYLVEGGYFKTWNEFWNGVDWDYWESRKDPACKDCMMHSGFEASVVRQLGDSPKDLWTMAKWNFFPKALPSRAPLEPSA
jgi:hypothetical protein